MTDLELLDEAGARAMEPELSCVAAYFSPSTGVIDSSALMLALEGHIRTNGSDVVLNTSVTEVSRNEAGDFVITIESEDGASSLVARNLVLAAGHGGTMLGRMLHAASGYRAPTTYLAKGHYFALSGRAPFQASGLSDAARRRARRASDARCRRTGEVRTRYRLVRGRQRAELCLRRRERRAPRILRA